MSIKSIASRLCVCTAVLVQCLSAQETNKIGTAAAPFLRIPVGARAAGMGSSFVSMVNDASGLYWNPSTLSSLNSNVLIIDHSPWLPGITFDFFGLAMPFENIGTFGVSATVLQTAEMDVTTPAMPMGTGETFTASSMALGVSYSRSLTDRFSIGGTVKYIHETIYNSSASGIAFDIGTFFETPFAGIRLGASISNFGTKMQMNGEDLNIRADIAPNQQGTNQSIVARLTTDQFDLPLVMRIGISGEVVNSENFRLTLTADGINPNDNAQSVDLGGEIGLLKNLIELRAGYKDLFLNDNEFGSTFGLSINEIKLVGDLSVTTEYAYQSFVHLGGSNRFTLGIRF
jgi:hypothetical protein